MKPSGIVTLLTDFGLSDPYVGVMKGALLTRFPAVRLVDLTHQLEAHDVLGASFWLERVYRWFPPGTVHLVVVDPGVGSERRAVALACDGHAFVGPDNGVFEPLVTRGLSSEPHELDPMALGASGLSQTFHGRDLFAPAAALVASGTRTLDSLGPPCSLQRVAIASGGLRSAGRWEARVVVIDRFGNVITDLEGTELPERERVHALVRGKRLPLVRTYADVASGECMALVGSFGTLEVAAREANAARLLGLKRGDRISLELDSDS